ncbi:hypothetical protein K469DRAFT_719583 [Zopfia rhizophila CBS 207.26]|uniref:Uncharacterized protein n=1 Tax=Zopfia rhizophila CBS 207.26 TaxID=1314779 RepID=A0A6A6DIA7_9PEZI|nr:hypothetical protein K469DRAFT_719583 [Zopfia rhizophila CBS 207.26]
MLHTNTLSRATASTYQLSRSFLFKPSSSLRPQQIPLQPYGPAFSRTFSRLSQNQKESPQTREASHSQRQKSQTTPSENPSIPAFNLKDLGASRPIYYGIIVVLSILGTIESVFWIKVIWAKFFTPEEDDRKEN